MKRRGSKRELVRKLMLNDSWQESRNLMAAAIIERQLFGMNFTSREKVRGLQRVDDLLNKHAGVQQ